MDITLSTGPIVGFILLYISSITYMLKHEFRLPGNLELQQEDLWMMYGPLAKNHWLLYIAIMPGGISVFGVPIKVGFTDGWLAGLVVFLIYNFSAFLIVKLITKIGIQPIFFYLSILTGPSGIFIVAFNIRLY